MGGEGKPSGRVCEGMDESRWKEKRKTPRKQPTTLEMGGRRGKKDKGVCVRPVACVWRGVGGWVGWKTQKKAGAIKMM